MGKVIPLKLKQSAEEKSIRKELQSNSDDLETWGKLLILKIQEGKFNPESDYAKAILRCIETVDVKEIEKFLLTISPIVEGMYWRKIDPQEKQTVYEKEIKELRGKIDTNALLDVGTDNDPFVKIMNAIYENYFQDQDFLDDMKKLVPDSETTYSSILGKTRNSNTELMQFFLSCFDIIITRYGLIGGLASIHIFSSLNLADRYSTSKLKISKKGRNAVFEIAENFLTEKFKTNKLPFKTLNRLFALRHILEKAPDDICNAIINVVQQSNIEEIHDAFFDDFNFNRESWTDIHMDILSGYKTIKYKRERDGKTADFMEDFYLALDEHRKYNDFISNKACTFFMYSVDCPLGHLLKGLKYLMYGLRSSIPVSEDSMTGFFSAGKLFYNKGLYKEALTCYKTALFNAVFLLSEEEPLSDNPLELVSFNDLVMVTKKLNSYEDSINFLSKFRLLNEHGLPIHQGVLNEIEATKTELEYERDARAFHKIDEFYELVAKEDFPSVQSHVQLKGQGKFVLTHDQLQVLLRKIEEKSDIIRGIKSISAKCDMLMYMHREVYDKQASILEVINDNHSSVKKLIDKNTEKILESMYKKNEAHSSAIDASSLESFYAGYLTKSLWSSMDADTRKHLMLGQHLYISNQYAVHDEYGFIAIEYSKAIENEFIRKVIESYITEKGEIQYEYANGIRRINIKTPVTLGEICTLINKSKVVKSKGDLLWPFINHVKESTKGREKIFGLSNALFNIKNKYRNPAAHPTKYIRQRLDEFRNLLFEKSFLKDYFDAIQITR